MVASLEGCARRLTPAGIEVWKEYAGRGAAVRSLRYADFNLAFAFVTEIALKAERMNRYNRLSVLLSTQERASWRGAGRARFIATRAT